MASRLDEVDAGVNTVVNNVHAVDLVLGVQIGIETLLDVLNNRSPGVIIVDKVAKTWGVDHSQAQTNAVFLNVSGDGLDADSLGGEVERWLLTLLWRVERGVKERVDESRLAEAGFTCTQSFISAPAMYTPRTARDLPTTITLKLKPFRTLLRCHWFGKFANPTYPVSFLRTMLRMSVAACAAALGSFEVTVWGAVVPPLG